MLCKLTPSQSAFRYLLVKKSVALSQTGSTLARTKLSHTGIEPQFLSKIYYAITACMTPRGGGGYSNFFCIRRLGPSIYRSPQKNIRNFKHPKKIFEMLATQKISQFCTSTLKKDPKLHRNDPQTSPIL